MPSLSSVPLIALLVSAAVAGPAGLRSTCVETCDGGTNFLYKPGLKYEYNYEVRSSFDLASTNAGEIQASAHVNIQVVTPCEFSLTLSDVSLPGSTNSDEFASAVTKNSLRFSFQDGRIEHLCSAEEEETWVLNFKKGILSQFHNSLTEFEGDQKVTEADINGICETAYKVKEENEVFAIEKYKTLTECQHGSNLKATLLSLGFGREYPDPNIGIKAESACRQNIKDGFVTSAKCTQDFKWESLHKHHHIEVASELNFLRTSQIDRDLFESHPARSKLIYQEVVKKFDISYVEDLLLKIEESKEVVQQDTPRLFSDLVKALGSMTFEELETLSTSTQDKPTYKYFTDAILLVGTPDAMKLVLLSQFSEVNMDIWLTSLSMIKNPTLPMFGALDSLVLNNPKPKAMLALSSLVYRYCSQDKDCHLRPEIKFILRSIESQLGASCGSKSEEEKSSILIALKSLGNAGRWINAGEVLQRCYMEDNPMEVRISAIEAWRKTPCEYDRDHLLATYYDESQDSELRIAAYLAVMKCPSESLVNAIRDRLTSEGVNQVGSFIWSHLTNLQESAAPDKQWIRQLIGEELLKNKFTTEALKMSRYYESSFYTDQFKVGGSAEADVIFSPSSFLPRSAMLNLTVDVFGTPLNLLEIGGRMKGFESFIEKFFGPEGYYPDETIQTMLKNMREAKEKEMTTIENSIDNSIIQPEGSFFIKLFGNELFYHHFHGHDNIIGQLGLSNPLEVLMEIFRKGKKDFTKSFNILDETVTFPSIVGFPVNMKLRSSATISLQIEGEFSYNKIFGTIKPSASVTTDSSMEIDAFVTRTGTTTKHSVSTATEIGGRAVVDGFRLIEFKLDVPQRKLDVFSNNYDHYVIKDGIEYKLEKPDNAFSYENCGSLLPSVYQYCTVVEDDYHLPASSSSYIQFYGDQSSYIFRAQFEPGNYNILLDAPGSYRNYKRMVSLKHDRNSFDAEIVSPELNLKGSGSYEIGPTSIEATGDVLINENRYLSGVFSHTFKMEEAGLVLSPKLILRDSNEVFLHLESDLKLDWGYEKITLLLHTDGIVGKNDLQFGIDRSSEISTTSLSLTTSLLKLKLHGAVACNSDKFEVNTEGTYSILFYEPEDIDASFKIMRKTKGEERTYSGLISANFLDFSADWETKLQDGGFSNKGHYKFDIINFDHDSHILYSTVGKTRKMDLRFLLHSAEMDFTALVEKKVEISDKHFKQAADFEIMHMRGSANTYIEYWKFMQTNYAIKSSGIEVFSIQFLAKEEPDGKWIIKSDLLGTHMDLSFHDKSIHGESLDYELDGEVISQHLATRGAKFSMSFKASKSLLDFDGSYTNVATNLRYFIKAKASSSDVEFATNIYKTISINGKFIPKEEGKGFEFGASVNDEEIVNAVAVYKDRSVEASLRYNDIDLSFLFSLFHSGIKASVGWSPTDQITIFFEYETQEKISLLASVQTPFIGWEKQQIMFSFNKRSLGDVYGQLGINWGNEDQFTFTIKNKLESNHRGHKYNGVIRISSTLKRLELALLELNHELTDNTIHTNLEYKMNESKLNGEFKAAKREDGYDASISFKYPSEDITAQANAIITINPSLVSFSANAKGTILPEMKLKGSYERNDGFDLNITGKIKEKSLSLTAYVRENPDEKSCIGRLKFTSSITKDFEINYSRKLSEDMTFEADIDMTSAQYPGEKYKIHVLGNLSDLKNIHATGYINGPDIAGKLKVSNQFTDKNFKALLNGNMNHHSIIVSATGSINCEDKTGSFSLETKTTFEALNNIKLTFVHNLKEEGRFTNVVINKEKFHATAFAFYKDYSNVEFKFDVSDLYKLHLRKVLDPYTYTSEYGIEFMFDQIDFKFFAGGRHPGGVILEFFLQSPWTKKVNFSLSPKNDQDLPLYEIIFGVEPFSFHGESMIYGNGFVAKGELTSTYWESELSFDIKLLQDLKARINVFDLVEIEGKGNLGPDGLKTDIDIKGQKYNVLPISIRFGGDVRSQHKKVFFSLKTNQNHQMIFDYIFNESEFLFSTSLNLPNMMENPIKADLKLKFHEIYDLKFTAEYAGKSYMLKGSLERELQGPTVKYEIKLEYDHPVLTKHHLRLQYNLEDRSALAVLKCDRKEYTFSIRHEGNTYIVDLTTPIMEWEKINAFITYKELFMEIKLQRNGKKFGILAQGTLKSTNGRGELLFTTPFTNYEQNKISFEYNTSQEGKKFLISANVGKKELKFENSFILDSEFPKILMKFYITNFYPEGKDLSFAVSVDTFSDSKTIILKGEKNDKFFEWALKLQPTKIDLQLKSDIPGWHSYQLEGTCEKTDGSLNAMFTIVSDNLQKAFSMSLRSSNKDLSLKVDTPIPNYETVSVDAEYKFINEVYKLVADVKVNQKEYNLFGEVTNSEYPKIKFLMKKEDQMLFDFDFKLRIERDGGIMVDYSFKLPDVEYKGNIYTFFTFKFGGVEASLVLPFSKFSNLVIDGDYDFTDKIQAQLNFAQNDIKKHFALKGKIDDSGSFEFDIETPFEGYEKLGIYGIPKILGKDLYMFEGELSRNDVRYKINLDAQIKEDGLTFETNLPYQSDNDLIITGDIDKGSLTFEVISKLGLFEPHKIELHYELDYDKASLALETTFDSVRNLEIYGTQSYSSDGKIIGGVEVLFNDQKLNLEGELKLAKYDSIIMLSASTSDPEEKYHFKWYLNLITNEKTMEILFTSPTLSKGLTITSNYQRENPYKAKFLVTTTAPNFKKLGLSYDFSIDAENKEILADVTLTKNDESFSFGVQGIFNDKRMMTKILLPFKNYQRISFDGLLDIQDSKGRLFVEVGDWVYNLEASFKLKDAYILISTPYLVAYKLNMILKYEWSPEEKLLSLKYEFNDYFYQIYVNLPTYSKRNFDLKIFSPFETLKAFELIGGYNPANRKELVKLGFTYNNVKYYFSTGYDWSECKADANLKLLTPFPGFTEVLVEGSVSLGESLSLSLLREGQYDILIQGKNSDEEISYGIETPLKAIRKSYGTYSRSKRSLDLMMMNDEHQGGIAASFNSLKMTLRSQFERLKLLEWEITKPVDGGIIFTYKRNQNYINFSATKNKAKDETKISIKSSIPGWEILALLGRLSEDELVGYLSGQLEETQITISGSGTFLPKSGNLGVDILTPYRGYEKVRLTGNYSSRKKEFTIQAKSDTNKKFKALIKFKRFLAIDIFIPHEKQSTIVDGKISVYRGNLSIKSRFPLIKSYSLKYSLDLKRKIKASFTISRNGIKRLDFQYERNLKTGLTHFMLMIHLFGNTSKFHYHRDAFRSLEISYTRNDNELKLKADGSEGLPESGKVNFKITNSFRVIPRTLTGDIVVDRTGKPKKMTMNVGYDDGLRYTFQLTYNIDLEDLSKGDYILTIEREGPLISISGDWEIDGDGQGSANLKVGSTTISATGTFGILHSDLTFKHDIPNLEEMYLGWKFLKNGPSRDYYIKFGRENRYVMAKFKGKIEEAQGDVSGEFRASKYMENDLIYTLNLKKTKGKLTGGGTFKYGDDSVEHTLHYFKRDAAKRAADFKWSASTNIKDFTGILLEGKYSLAEKLLDFDLSWDIERLSFHGKLDSFSWQGSSGKITGHLPNGKDGQVTLGHDFSNPLEKSIFATGKLGKQAVSYSLKWKRNEHFSFLDLTGKLDSAIFGLVTVKADYDLTDLDNAFIKIDYKRNDQKFVNFDWSRKAKKDSFEHNLTFKSHFEQLPSLKGHIQGKFKSGFSYIHTIECHGKETKLTIDIGKKKAELSFHTPFEFIDDISAVATYNFKQKSKTFNIVYKRGKVDIKLDFKLKIDTKKSGSLNLKLDTPYAIAKNLSIDATWKSGNLNALYKRNDIEMTVKGKAEVKSGKSSFDISFTPPGKRKVDLKLKYDIEDFKEGKGSSQKKLMDVKFGFAGQTISFVINGYRNSEKVYLEIDGSSSFAKFKKFYALLDSELNLSQREGHLKIMVDDFEFEMRNNLEIDEENFYFESHISSTLTPLPGIKIGFGKEGTSCIVTLGVGDTKEVTITFDGTSDFKKGISGRIDLPHRNLKNVAFDVGYSFKGENKLAIDFVVDLGNGNKIEGELLYNSDGVRTRLSSPWTGIHGLRLRRSISDNEFFTEVGINDYNCQLRFLKSLNRGFLIEGEIFGRKFKADVYLNEEFTEGRLILNTPFEGYETLGGHYKLDVNRKVKFNAVLHLFVKIVADVDANIGLYSGIDVNAHFLINDKHFRASLLANEKRGTLQINANVDIPYLDEPIEFTFIGHRGRNYYSDGSILFRDFVGRSHTIEFTGTDNHRTIDMNVKVHSIYLHEEFKLKMSKFSPFKIFEISSKAFTIAFNYDVNDKQEIKGSSKLIKDGQSIYDINVDLSTSTAFEFNIVASILKGSYKMSSNIEYSRLSQSGKGYFIYSINSHSNARLIVEKNREEALAEFTLMNEQSHKLRANLKYPVEGTEFSFDVDSPASPKISLRYVRMMEKPFLIDMSLDTAVKRYAFSLTTDINVTKHFLSQENAFFKAELSLPNLKLPYSLDVKYYNEEDIKGIKFEVKDGKLFHSMSGKFSSEYYGGKVYLLVESPLLRSTDKAYFSLVYNFGPIFKFIIEASEDSTQHNLFLELDPSEKTILANVVSPIIYSGLIKLEGKIGKINSNEGDAQITLHTAESKYSANMRGKMLENEIDAFVSLNTPVEGFETVKFGGRYFKGRLTKVLLFAEPYNFKASSSFGLVDSVIKFGLELKANVSSWEESSIEIDVPLNTFNPRILLNVGHRKYHFEIHYGRTQIGGDLGYEVRTPYQENEFNIHYRTKAPYEIGLKRSGFGEPHNYHIMFDSSFLILSDAIMVFL